jgi:hypothetical protein
VNEHLLVSIVSVVFLLFYYLINLVGVCLVYFFVFSFNRLPDNETVSALNIEPFNSATYFVSFKFF